MEKRRTDVRTTKILCITFCLFAAALIFLFNVRTEAATKYTVSFWMSSKTQPKAYKKLDKTVNKNTVIALPKVPERSGYDNNGWKMKIGNNYVTYKVGTKIKVTNKMIFYADQVKKTEKVTLTLHNFSGKVVNTYAVKKNSWFMLPSILNNSTLTFMGWSTKKCQVVSVRTSSKKIADYYPGHKIKMTGNVDLYPVLTNKTKEPDLNDASLAKLDETRYSNVIFVGDSRTERMGATLRAQGLLNNRKNIHFVAQSGAKMYWLQSQGASALKALLKSLNTSSYARQTAVVFNIGVNCLGEVSSYISFLNRFASTIKQYNCRLFVMSVNPVNSAQIQKVNFMYRTERQVIDFNSALKKGISTDFTWLDSWTWMMRTGYGMDRNLNGVDMNFDDGLHYTTKTCKRLADWTIRRLNNL